MKMMLMDGDDSVSRRILRVVLVGIPLVIVLGWPAWVFVGLLLIMPIGLGMAMRQGEVAGKPFSFCLPGFRKSLRRRYFVGAAVMGLGLSFAPLTTKLILDLRHPPIARADLIEGCLAMIAAFLVGMVLGLIVGTLRFVLSRLAWSIVMLLSIPLFLMGVVGFSALVEYPLVGIPFGIIACALIWLRLGDMQRVRQGHRALLEDTLERRAQVGVTKTASPWIDTVFRHVMESRRPADLMQYIWGSLYRAFGLAFSYWIWIAASIAVGALIVGYAGGGLARAAFVTLGLTVMRMHLPMGFDALLLPAGRRERCYATLVVAITAWLLIVGVAGLVMISTWLFSLFLSSLGAAAYANIAPESVYLSGLLVPWLLGRRLLEYRWPVMAGLIGLLTMASFVAMCLLYITETSWLRPVEPILHATALVGGWPLFLMALRDACTGASLTRPDSCETGAE